MKRFVGALLATVTIVGLSLAITPARADSVPAEQIVAPNEPGLGYFGFRSSPDFGLVFSSSHLLGFESSGNQVSAIHVCTSVLDSACSKADLWKYVATLAMCTSATDSNCIEAITAKDKDGNPLATSVVQSFPSKRDQDYVGDVSQNLPTGGQLPLIDIPGAPHAGGSLYLPEVRIQGRKDLQRGDKSFNVDNINIGLYAVTIAHGNNYSVYYESDRAGDYVNRDWNAGKNGTQPGCIVNDTTTCAQQQALPLDVKFGIKIRTSFPIPGWFHGRAGGPEIQMESTPNGGTSLSLTANPVISPIIYVWKKKSDLPTDLTTYIASLPKPLGGSGSGAGNHALQDGDPNLWSLLFDTTNFDQGSMNMFLHWLPVVGDKATADPTYWTFIAEEGTLHGTSCNAPNNTLAGIVSTNATQYLAGPPSWNANDQTLDYKVASAHFQANGEVFKGSYDLAINADMARCLYGFSKAPVKASVSIVSSDGTEQVATTVISETNNWIYLAAKGFTFSNPLVKVKLTQDKPISPATSNPVKSLPTPSKATLLTCIKGKATKLVKSSTCPTGYKVKGQISK
jgi:hypothetical protein